MPSYEEILAQRQREGGSGYNLLDVVGSPIYNLLETASGIPALDDAGLDNWLRSSPLTRGVRRFQRENPIGAGVADVASMFVPYVGWASALNKARTGTGLVSGGLNVVNRLGQRAARLAPNNPSLAFVLGEGARIAPLEAGMTLFDYAGGRYDDPGQALGSFLGGTALGAGTLFAGMKALPLVNRHAPEWVAGAWRAAFEPSAELQEFYGFSDNVRARARDTARTGRAQEALNPSEPIQSQAARLWDLMADVAEAQRASAAGEPVSNPELLEIDFDLIAGAYDDLTQRIVDYVPDRAESLFKTNTEGIPEPLARTIDTVVEQLTRPGPHGRGLRIRSPLNGKPGHVNSPDQVEKRLELPAGWLHDVELPGVTFIPQQGSKKFMSRVGLKPGSSPFTSVSRVTPSGQVQTWGIMREAEDGAWLVTTEIKPLPNETLRMWGRRGQSKLDPEEDARAVFSFRTNNPGRFFEELRLDADNPDPGVWENFEVRIPQGKSDLLDKLVAFRQVFLARETVREALKASKSGKGRSKYVEELLAGPTMGKELANVVETYMAPAKDQLRDNPLAAGVMGLYRAAFDAADGFKNALLYGTASIPENTSPIAALFTPPNMNDEGALITQLRKALLDDPQTVELIRQFDKAGNVSMEALEGTPAGEWLKRAFEVNNQTLKTINQAIGILRELGVTDARLIPQRAGHFGLSRGWDGSVFVPIYEGGSFEPIAVIAGGNLAHAQKKALAWIKAENNRRVEGGNRAASLRQGKHFIAGEDGDIPEWVAVSTSDPSLLEPRAGMRGYEHEFEPYNHVDDFVAELEENYSRRLRYGVSVIADALSGGKFNEIQMNDKKSWNILKTRIAQMKGTPGPFQKRLEQVVDGFGAKYFGTRSLTKASEATNEFMFHMLHGFNFGTSLLNLTSVLQTQLPEGMNLLLGKLPSLRNAGYHLPVFGPDQMPRPGFHAVMSPMKLVSGAFKRAMNPDQADMEVFQAVFNSKAMGATLANEFTGQDRVIAQRVSEGLKNTEDAVFWLKRASSFLMAKSEQVSRTLAAGMALEAMALREALTGVKIPLGDKIDNVLLMVQRTNFMYMTADRPMMYTTPVGAVFGNQKTWVTNYMFLMAEYLGLGIRDQNWAPLLMTLGTTSILGGVFAVPLIANGADFLTETFADQDAREFMFERFGETGNAISFGLPAMFGMSLHGNVAAPGSNLAHDTEFFFSVMAFERAKLMGRAMGRAWDDATVLGQSPMSDPLFRRQFSQAFAPRAMHRSFEALMDEQLTSAATGYPMVREFGFGARMMHALGFRDADVALQYEVYGSLIADRQRMRERVALFGEAYAMAAINNDRRRMLELLQQATVQGLDISSVMQSAQIRMRNAGVDMFGRGFSPEQVERYERTLENAGVER